MEEETTSSLRVDEEDHKEVARTWRNEVSDSSGGWVAKAVKRVESLKLDGRVSQRRHRVSERATPLRTMRS